MTTINDKQLKALARFNREYNVAELVLINTDNDKLQVQATIRAGTNLKSKGFFLDEEGGLAGIIKEVQNEDSQT